MATTASPRRQDFAVPDLFTSWPPVQDDLIATKTSTLQDSTIEECLPYLRRGADDKDLFDDSLFDDEINVHGVPRLNRPSHIAFLHKSLEPLPGVFVPADASRPWMFYWNLSALFMLGEDITIYRSRLIETIRPLQNAGGGVAGGFGQTSHLATTYATVLALTLVGGEDAYDVVDRRAMWRWLSSLKQPDGGFRMAIGGEEDVRGAYCAAVIVSLLNLPLDLASVSPASVAGYKTLFDGLADWIGQCQTYEGGISAKPGSEAHGAYAFCALGCLAIIDSPHRSLPSTLDMPLLISWLSSRQYAPEGGLAGRTNKLVDGCYSHWIGGCWPLVEAALAGPRGSATDAAAGDAAIFNRNALIRYIMCCCQDRSKRGGLRDKPSKFSDAYHSCYVLSGLSAAQHQWDLVEARPDPILLGGDKWTFTPYLRGEQVFDEGDRVGAIHPVYAIPQHSIQDVQAYFSAQKGF